MAKGQEGIGAWLETLSDEQLERLLDRRPDLLARPPAHLVDLGSRLSATSSITQVLGTLDRGAVQVAALLAHQGGRSTSGELIEVLGRTGPVPRGHVIQALTTLAEVGIAWPHGKVWRCASGMSALVAPLLELGLSLEHLLTDLAVPLGMPALRSACELLGLGAVTTGREAVLRMSELVGDQVLLAAVLAKAPVGTSELLERLCMAGPPVEPEEATWLLDRCLVVRGTYEMLVPAEVIRFQRGERVVAQVSVEPALVPPKGRPVDGQDRVMVLLAQVRALLAHVLQRPVKSLADGGVGVQEQRRIAKALSTDLDRTVWLLRLCGDAGLLSRGLQAGRLTPAAMVWTGTEDVDAAMRLLEVALAQRVVAHEHSGPVLDRSWRGNPSGVPLHEVAARCTHPAADLALVQWLLWNRASLHLADASQVLSLLTDLGLRAGGWPSPWLAPLLEGDVVGAAEALRKALPPEQEDVVLQADGTAVVGGRPSEGLRAFLDLLGERESDRTWRLTPASVRNAFDQGRTTQSLLEELDERSTHRVPQVLSVLIADVGARHGRIRVTPSSTLLTVEDPQLLTELLHDRLLKPLGLVEVTPGVLSSTRKPAEVMDALRVAGHAPVGPTPVALKVGLARPEPPVQSQRYGPTAGEVVAALRRAGVPRAAGAPIESPGGLMSARWVLVVADQLPRADLARLVHAVATGLPIEIDYQDSGGAVTTRVVEGLVREGARLAGWCRLRHAERTFYPDQVLAVRPVA